MKAGTFLFRARKCMLEPLAVWSALKIE